MKQDRKYLSYLLRLWMVKENGEYIWRASLESPKSGAQVGFDSLESLAAYLKEQTGTVCENTQSEKSLLNG